LVIRCAVFLFFLAFSAIPMLAQQTVLLVGQKASSTVGFYTPDGKALATVPVGKHPHEMVISPDGRYAYTADNGTMAIEDTGLGNNTVSMIDIRARKRSAVISLGNYHRPHGIAIDARTGDLLVTTEIPARLLVIDGKSHKILRAYDPKGKTPHIVTLGKDGKFAYVSNAGSNTVSAIELASGKVTLIPVGTRPEGSTLSKDGTRLYVANRFSNEITIVDTAKKAKVGSIKTGAQPVRVQLTPDQKYAVYGMANGHAIGFADLAQGKEVDEVSTDGNRIVSMHLSPDGKWALGGAADVDLVYIVDIASRKIRNKFSVPKGSNPDPVQAVEIPRK
jgi:YVTN family beta-propeller protein